MATNIKYKTKSEPGAAILGVLFLLCAAVLLATPCLGLIGSLFGPVPLPHGSHELLEALFMLGVCLVMAVATLALGVLCLNATLLPKTLCVTDNALQLFWLKKQIGEVPFANIKESDLVLTRAMAGQTAEGVAAQAMFRGGWIAAAVAQSRFKPDEPIGFVIRVVDPGDPDMFWPKGFFKRKNPKRIEVRCYWKSPHPTVVRKIAVALARSRSAAE